MSDPDRPGFSRRHREGAERVRQKNLEGRGADNVVPLRKPQPKREFRLPAMLTHPAVLWAGIVAILIVVYFVRQAL